MTVIDADKLPVRRITRVRRHLKGGKPWYSRERVQVVLLNELEIEKGRRPANRMEKILKMDPDHLTKFLMALMDGDDRIGYCQKRKTCMEALDSDAEDTITPEQCEQCLKEWLLKEA